MLEENKKSTKSSFCVDHSWEWGLPWSVADRPSDTPLEKKSHYIDRRKGSLILS